MSPNRKSTALVADDHGLYRVGLRLLLEDQLGFDEVVEAGGFDEALDILASNPSIKLALFDLSMPGMGGPSSLAVVRSNYPDLRVTVISGLDDRETIAACMSHGLNGYIPKSMTDDNIVAALKQIAAGKNYIPQVTSAKPAPAVHGHAPLPGTSGPSGSAPSAQPSPGLAAAGMPAAVMAGLTPRQRDVLAGIVRGLANKEIARELNIAEGTVKIHLAALFSHFDVRNRTELATRAQRLFG